jgi:hypothetical protein
MPGTSLQNSIRSNRWSMTAGITRTIKRRKFFYGTDFLTDIRVKNCIPAYVTAYFGGDPRGISTATIVRA